MSLEIRNPERPLSKEGALLYKLALLYADGRDNNVHYVAVAECEKIGIAVSLESISAIDRLAREAADFARKTRCLKGNPECDWEQLVGSKCDDLAIQMRKLPTVRSEHAPTQDLNIWESLRTIAQFTTAFSAVLIVIGLFGIFVVGERGDWPIVGAFVLIMFVSWLVALFFDDLAKHRAETNAPSTVRHQLPVSHPPPAVTPSATPSPRNGESGLAYEAGKLRKPSICEKPYDIKNGIHWLRAEMKYIEDNCNMLAIGEYEGHSNFFIEEAICMFNGIDPFNTPPADVKEDYQILRKKAKGDEMAQLVYLVGVTLNYYDMMRQNAKVAVCLIEEARHNASVLGKTLAVIFDYVLVYSMMMRKGEKPIDMRSFFEDLRTHPRP